MQNMTNQRWYYMSGEDNDTAVSTRIRLARNLEDFPFPQRMTLSQKEELHSRVCAAVKDIKVGDKSFMQVRMNEVSDIQAVAMVERHLISPEFAFDREGKMLLLLEDESVSIMLCEEDHLRIQVMKSGKQVENTLKEAQEIERALSEKLKFAFDERLGYLTACPTNLGTAMRASVMLHLPALEQKGQIPSLSNTVSKIGLTLRGSLGENSPIDTSLYQLSNQITLGISEESAAQNLLSIAEQVIEKERMARRDYEKIEVEDKAFRSLAILKNARLMSFKELGEHIGALRIGKSFGFLKDISNEKLSSLVFDAKPANIALCNNLVDSPRERDIIRAKTISQIFS